MNKIFTPERLRAGFSYALAFIFCIGLFLSALTASALIFAKTDLILYTAEKSEYTSYALTEMTEELNDLAIPSGLPEDFFDDKVVKSDFETLFYDCLENTSEANTEYKLSVEQFENEIYQYVTDYSKNVVGDYSDEVDKDLKLFATECGNIYLSYVNPSLLSYIFTLISSARSYILYGNLAALLLSLIAAVIIFKLNRAGSFLKYTYFATMGSALTIGVAPLLLLLTNEVDKISISSKCLYAATTTYAISFLWLLVIAAAVLFLVSLVLILIKVLIFRK